jgi:pyridoxine kinase
MRYSVATPVFVISNIAKQQYSGIILFKICEWMIILNNIKKIAAVHDLSGFGRCSLTAAIPVLSVMGVQCCPMPTAVLSNQTGFESYSYLDFTPYMPEYINQWEKLDIEFDAIYTGFLGSEQQIDVVIDFITRFKKADTWVAVDPVMGDNGKLYPIYSDSMCDNMKRLISHADIVMPNLTEAAFLAGWQHPILEAEKADIIEIAERISQLGPQKIIITGAIKQNIVTNHVFDFSRGLQFETSSGYNHKTYSGAGDVFASIICGSILNGESLQTAVIKASEFVEKAVNYTSSIDTNEKHGIMFEKFLKELAY